LFEAAAADVSGDYRDLAVARIQSRALGRASTGSEYDLVDLYSLAEQMREQYPKQAKAILDILDEAVPTNGTNTVGCYGVNLFYPYYNKRYFEAIWRDDYTTLNAFPHYSNYLTRFSQIWLGTDMLDAFNDLSDPEAVTNSTFTLQLTGEQKECFASAGFYVLRRISDEQYAMVSYSRNVTEQDGLLTANFDGRAIYYTVGSDLPRMPTIVHNSSYDNIDEYLCMPFYSRGLSDGEKYAQQSTDLLLRFDTVTGEVTINGLYEKTDDDALASGKRREIDPSEWETVTFYDCSGFYLTRDSAGRIIDYFDWTKGEWITGNEYSAAQPISFSYEPIYDDGSEYFVMFRITDAQGGCCCSELMPIRLVERPPEEHSVTEREWTEGSSVLLEETDDCALYLRYLHFLDTDTDRICVVMENKSGDREMLLRVGDITADDSFLIENGGIEIRGVSPGETKYSVIDGLSAYCTLTGIELPSTLSFAVLAETPSMDVLVKDEYSVRICDAVTADSQWYPFLGARADTQILYQADDVKVTLEALGFQPSDKDSYYPSFSPPEVLHVLLKIENGSAGDLTFACFGLVANGMMIDLQSNSFKTKTIASDTTACVLYSKELSAFSSYEITSISDLVLYLCCAPAGSYHYDYRGSIACPVALTQKGAYVAPEHGGTLVYEDDTLQLYRKQINSADLSLCYVNKTDQPLVVRVVSQPLTDTEESRKLSDAFVPQNAMLCSKCSFFTSWAKGNSIPVVLEVRVGEREYRSAVFTLSISEEAAP